MRRKSIKNYTEYSENYRNSTYDIQKTIVADVDDVVVDVVVSFVVDLVSEVSPSTFSPLPSHRMISTMCTFCRFDPCNRPPGIGKI